MLAPDDAPGDGSTGGLGLPRVERSFQPLVYRHQGRAGREELGDPHFFELRDVGVGDDPATEHHHFVEPALAEQLEDTGKQRHVRAGQERQADGIRVFLQRGLGNLLRRLVQTRVDHLKPTVAQGTRDDLGPAVVTVETGFRDDDSIPALHAGGTLVTGPRARPTGATATFGTSQLDPPGWTLSPIREYTLSVAARENQCRSDLRLLLGAAIAVIVGGILVAAAILAITARGKLPNVKVAQPFGLAAAIHQQVKEGGPINIAGLSGDDGFWVATEHHQLVALLVHQPKPASCTLRWRGSKNTFTCDDRPVKSTSMARYHSFTQPSGPRKGLLMVELRNVLPVPAP